VTVSGKDLSELAALLKTERKLSRHERRAAARASELTANDDASTAPASAEREPSFADYFRLWSEYKGPNDKDRELFRTVVKDAVPLTQSPTANVRRPAPQPNPVHRDADEQAALIASQLALYPSPMSWDIGADIEDEQSYLRAGVSPDLLRKLRRGQWTINAEIDLHNHTQDEAHEALMEFMRKARAADWRCLRIIHGKGLSSHQKIPVLRNKVRRWLQLKDEVLAYCEPRPNGGGSGAVLVLLRGAR
jgi:DNA-nicking Smr family endonuclease